MNTTNSEHPLATLMREGGDIPQLTHPLDVERELGTCTCPARTVTSSDAFEKSVKSGHWFHAQKCKWRGT